MAADSGAVLGQLIVESNQSNLCGTHPDRDPVPVQCPWSLAERLACRSPLVDCLLQTNPSLPRRWQRAMVTPSTVRHPTQTVHLPSFLPVCRRRSLFSSHCPASPSTSVFSTGHHPPDRSVFALRPSRAELASPRSR